MELRKTNSRSRREVKPALTVRRSRRPGGTRLPARGRTRVFPMVRAAPVTRFVERMAFRIARRPTGVAGTPWQRSRALRRTTQRGLTCVHVLPMVLACTRFGRNPTTGGGDGAVNPRSASNSVVVGIDGSRASINAARWGVAEAVQRDVPLRLVHAVPASQCTTRSVQRDVGNADLALLSAEDAGERRRKARTCRTGADRRTSSRSPHGGVVPRGNDVHW
jgi:hypothetical protein